MKRFFSVLPVAAILAFATAPVFAQSEEAAVNEADKQFPVVAEGDNYLRDSFETWEVYCAKGKEESTCEVFELLTNKNDDPVARINILRLPEGGEAVAGVTFVAPLGTLLPAGVAMRIDSSRVRNHPFGWCEQAGCVARFGLSGDDMEDLSRGESLFFTIVNLADPDEPIELSVPLAGIGDAWASIPVPPAAAAAAEEEPSN
ncbi:MAG: invasion associated locus B family protein [Candidatus Halichondribacter symbioticus]